MIEMTVTVQVLQAVSYITFIPMAKLKLQWFHIFIWMSRRTPNTFDLIQVITTAP